MAGQVTRASDWVIFRYEMASCFRGGLAYRFIPLMPAGIFLAAWTGSIASPFAAVIWLAFLGLEPRINNIFYSSPRELEALSLFPAEWRRIVLLKNLATLLAGLCAMTFCSIVVLFFSPVPPGGRLIADAALYLATVAPPMLSLGNEASLRYPRRDAGIFSGGLYEAFWMSLTLLLVSAPYFLITGLIESEWLCVPYAAAAALAWYFRSVPRTAAEVMDRKNNIWLKTGSSSNY